MLSPFQWCSSVQLFATLCLHGTFLSYIAIPNLCFPCQTIVNAVDSTSVNSSIQ